MKRIQAITLPALLLGLLPQGFTNWSCAETPKLMAQAAGQAQEEPHSDEGEQKELEKVIEKSMVPIKFFGRVVDEKGNPVEDSTVIFSVTDDSKNGATSYQVKSGKGGLFSLTGVKGSGTTVTVSKNGYYIPRPQRKDGYEIPRPQGGRDFFEYSGKNSFIPDLKNPVVFMLRKVGELVDLIQKDASASVPRDGTPVRFNFLTGKMSPDGELEVRTWKPKREDARKSPFDWKVIIGIPNGGLKECSDEFPFTAPENGYVQSVEINMPASLGTDWRMHVERQFYVMFGKPKKYGRLIFDANGNGYGCSLEYYINPAGLRNLAPKPDEQGLWR